jgi:hypothetical protein
LTRSRAGFAAAGNARGGLGRSYRVHATLAQADIMSKAEVLAHTKHPPWVLIASANSESH